MFDDLKQDNQQNQNQLNQQPASPQAPAPANPSSQVPPAPQAAASGGGVDDMFADVDPAPPAPNIMNKPSAIQSGKMTPVSPNAPQSPQVPPASDMIVAEGGGGGGFKKFVAVVIVILILGVAGAAVYYFMNRDSGDSANGDNMNITNEVSNTNTNTNTNTNDDVQDDNDFDDDFDGLSNAEEKSLGTDPTIPDTDNDGLFDGQEVNEYNTNPLTSDTDMDGLTDYEEVETYATDPNKADTDGDGYLDGVEVDNGYNPLGQGLLEGDNTNTIGGEEITYITYADEVFGYSISRPEDWTMQLDSFGPEEQTNSGVLFWPGVPDLGGHYISIGAMRVENMTEQEKADTLLLEEGVEDFTLGGLPAKISSDRSRVLLFRDSPSGENYTDVFLLSYDFTLSGEPNPDYMKIFNAMINSFVLTE